MKSFFYYLLLSLIFSCGKDKIIQLPKVDQSKINEITDVSAAYIFYDETLPDSVELNRKNLISTTNWLVNVDKRLKLKQAIPKIVFIQNKKRNAEMHKNENAKNFYTCNDLSINNLGFIDFTNTYYHSNNSDRYLDELKNNAEQIIKIKVHSLDSTYVSFISNDTAFTHTSNERDLLNHLQTNLTSSGNALLISELNNNLSFQDYITYKALLTKMEFKNLTIANDEFVFN
jgi:hypothetical protein